MPLSNIRIIHQDAAVLVIDKPTLLLSVPGRAEDNKDCLMTRLQEMRGRVGRRSGRGHQQGRQHRQRDERGAGREAVGRRHALTVRPQKVITTLPAVPRSASA